MLATIASKVLDNEKAQGFDFSSFSSRRTIRQAIASSVEGMEQLRDIDVAKKEFHVKHRLMHTPLFRRENGRGRFVVHQLPSLNVNDDFPFCLMSVRSEGQFNSIIYEEQDSYREVGSRWTILLNLQDMQRLTLNSGDKVSVTSAYGEMRGVSVKAFDLPLGNVMAYYPEANVLIGRDRDQRSQTPAFKSVAVNIQKQFDA